MKKLAINEEFIVEGNKFVFVPGPIDKNNKPTIILKNLGPSKGGSKEFIPPKIEEVITFFNNKGYTTESAIKMHQYYTAGNWHNRDGKQIKNWQMTAISVWLRDEHKIKVTDKKEPTTDNKFLFG